MTNLTSTSKQAPRSPRSNGAVRHTRRWLPYGGAVLLAIGLTVGLWPKPVPVETAVVSVGPLRTTVNEEGKTRIKQRYVIAAPVSGQLRRIPFKAGAEVRAGETALAIVDPLAPTLLDARTRSAAEAKRDTASANVEKAKAANDFAASELRRFEKLRAEQTLSVQEMESVQLRATAAARDLAAAESALRQAMAELAEFSPSAAPSAGATPTEIKSPVNGRVLRIFEESSRVVMAGTPLLEVGDPRDLEVVVEVLSRDGAVIRPGDKVEFEQWGGGMPLAGRVRLVEPAAFTKISALGVEEQRVNVIADLTTPVAERPGVGDNFRVEARIVTWEAEDAVKVPAGAVFRRGEKWAAFVVENSRARLRSVEVGRTSGTETQILSGLKKGDLVIVYPGSRVQDGGRVREIRV